VGTTAGPITFHPVASAIDTELPAAPEHVHIMIGSKPTWAGKPNDDG
jgi:hypothetical protein